MKKAAAKKPAVKKALSNIVMPKLSYRFRVSFPDSPLQEAVNYIDSVYLPGIYPKNSESNEICDELSIVFQNDSKNTVAQLIKSQINLQNAHPIKEGWFRNPPEQPGIRFNVFVFLLEDGSENSKVSEWWLFGDCLITSVRYSSLDYKSADPCTISVNVTPRYTNTGNR